MSTAVGVMMKAKAMVEMPVRMVEAVVEGLVASKDRDAEVLY